MKYRARPVEVEGLEIKEVWDWSGPGLQCKLEDGTIAIATPEMMARYRPVAGDFWVRQGDGYAYVNPRQVFIRKYGAVEETKPSPAKVDIGRATELTEDVEAAVRDMFEYHKWDQDMIEHGTKVRTALEIAALTIIKHVPPGPDRSVAIRKLREARMDANSAITHGGKY